MALRQIEDGVLQANRLVDDGEQQVAQEEAFGGGALVVAAAPGLQAPGDILANALTEAVLDLDQERARLGQPREPVAVGVENLQQAGEQFGAPRPGQDVGFGQHHRMGQIGQQVFAEAPHQTRDVRHLLAIDQNLRARTEPGFLEEHIVLAGHRVSPRYRRPGGFAPNRPSDRR